MANVTYRSYPYKGINTAKQQKNLEIAISSPNHWITKSGEIWKISEMEDKHLINTIRLFTGMSEKSKSDKIPKKHEKKLYTMITEAEKRGLNWKNEDPGINVLEAI